MTHTKEFISQIHNLPCSEIAKQIRKDLKQIFPKIKFSVTSKYNKISVDVISGDKDIFSEEFKKAKTWDEFQILRENERGFEFNNYRKDIGLTYTDFGRNFIIELKKIVNLYNHDNSDIQVDYFDVNYYTSILWDNYKVV